MIARYAGTCAKCGQTVNVGDSITWSRKHRGRVLHIDCPKSATSETTTSIPLPDCPQCYSMRNVRVMSPVELAQYESATHRCIVCNNFFAFGGALYTAQSDGSYTLTSETKRVETEPKLKVHFTLTEHRNKINAIKAIRGATNFNVLQAKLASEGECFEIDATDRYKVRTQLSEYGTVTFDDQATVTTKPVKVPTATNGSHPTDDLSAVIAQAIARYLPAPEAPTVSIDETAVREIVAREIASIIAPTVVTVARAETGETKDMGVQHRQFPLLLSIIASGCNVWMSGPAGSGKTTAADNAAQALDKKFYFCGAQSNEYGLLGFRTATGELVRTPFREAYENGGVFLFDEIDASAPTALLAFNAALANGWCAFPDGMIRKHTDFIVIAAANTFGLGGTNDYVGRMKQDAAFIDRFVFLGWDVDESLESSTCGNTVWAKRVQKVRAKIKAKGIKCIVSPRASYYGAKLLAQGIDQDTVETLVLRKGLDETTWESIS